MLVGWCVALRAWWSDVVLRLSGDMISDLTREDSECADEVVVARGDGMGAIGAA